MKLLILAAILVITGWATPGAVAQQYPGKPIRMVVPYPPGGAGDIHSRQVAEKLDTVLGQAVIVENRAGASGNIGAEYVAKSPPDGYTIVFSSISIAINQAVSSKLPFNVLTDFAPISLTLTSQSLLVVRPSLPVANVKELIAYGKANPGKLSFASTGVGGPWLAVELLKSLTGVEMLHVPYKGDGPAIIDLIGGRVDMFATTIAAVDAYHRAGKVRGLAVTSRKRAVSLPDVPTMEEAGVPGYEFESWFGFLAPVGTPRPIINRLNAAMVQVISMPDVQRAITDVGLIPMTSTPEQYQQRIQSDVERFSRIVKSAGIRPE